MNSIYQDFSIFNLKLTLPDITSETFDNNCLQLLFQDQMR